MPIQAHSEDILAHIAGPETLASKASATQGCVTLISLVNAPIEVCWQIFGDSINVKAELLGNPLGHCELTPAHPTCTLGGEFAVFKY